MLVLVDLTLPFGLFIFRRMINSSYRFHRCLGEGTRGGGVRPEERIVMFVLVCAAIWVLLLEFSIIELESSMAEAITIVGALIGVPVFIHFLNKRIKMKRKEEETEEK